MYFFSPPSPLLPFLCWSVLFLCTDYDGYNPFCSIASLLLCFDIYVGLMLTTGVFASAFLFLGFLFWFNSWSGRAHVFKKTHAYILHFLNSCIIENSCHLHLYLNDILMGCNISESLFLCTHWNFVDIASLSSAIVHCSGKSDFFHLYRWLDFSSWISKDFFFLLLLSFNLNW